MTNTLKITFSVFFFSIQWAMGSAVNTSNTILFKITSTHHDQVSYLFGTHHAFGKSFFDSLTLANQYLSTCNILVKENLNIPGQMAEDIINQRENAIKWKKYLNKKDLSFIKDLFANSPTDFKKMTPTEMYVFLNRHYKKKYCLTKDTNDSYLSLDDYIGNKAKKQNLKLVGLETTEDQIKIINKDVEGMPRKVHKKRLSSIIKHIKSGNSNNCEETEWYRQMDIDYQLEKPCQNTLMLTDRNLKWMDSLQKYLDSDNCFIAVGLSHLMYECGLINQLKKLGYTITPVMVK